MYEFIYHKSQHNKDPCTYIHDDEASESCVKYSHTIIIFNFEIIKFLKQTSI